MHARACRARIDALTFAGMAQTVGQFVYVIRKRISVPSDKAIFIFVNNTLPPTAALMSSVYEQHRDEDGFMCAAPAPVWHASSDPQHTRWRHLLPPRDARRRPPQPCPPRYRRYMMYSGENTFGSAEPLPIEWLVE